ncbi:MAG: histidine kinase [Ilumatobacteraceae bacterium]
MTTWTRVTTLWARVGPRARDLAFIVVALLGAAAEALAGRHESALTSVFVGVVGLVGAAALWWRRSHPVVVTLIGIGVFAVTLVPVTVAVGLFSLAVRRRDRVLAMLTLAVAAAFALVQPGDLRDRWATAAVLGLLEAGFCAAAGSYVGARHDLVAALRDRAARAEEQQELRAEQATLGERSRIAREMHDVLAHKVSLIAMHAGALEVNATAGPDQVRETAGLIRVTAREAMEDLRDVLGVLRAGTAADGTDLAPPPRRDDLGRLVESSRAAGVQAELVMDLDELPDAVARTAHRIVQEALTNVHKHARGAATVVTIAGDEHHGVTVEVVNRRPVGGAALLPGSGAGLLGLGERVALAGGSFGSGPTPEGGWRVSAWLPWVSGAVPIPASGNIA